MKKIYLDNEFVCHISNLTGDYKSIETDVFDDKPDKYIQGMRYVPSGETWVRSDGVQFVGEMIAPAINSQILDTITEVMSDVDDLIAVEVEPLAQVMRNIKNAIPESLQGLVTEYLTSVPTQGAEWNTSKNYIQGDTVMFENSSYTALKYSKNKAPNVCITHWELTPQTPTYPTWDETPEMTQISKNDIYTHDDFTWICIKQNFKSTLTEPKTNSNYWEVYEL